jgi:prolyl oligopeptidase
MFGRAIFSPSGRRCLVGLLHEGIVIEWREFDIERRTFVSGGFRIPPAKASVGVWRDEDTLVVTADWGKGTIDDQAFPMVIKEWRRGQPFDGAREILRRSPDHLLIHVVSQDGSTEPESQHRTWTIVMKVGSRGWWQLDQHGRLAPMTIPAGVQQPALQSDHYVFAIPGDADWAIAGKTWKAGALVAIPASQVTLSVPPVQLVFEPRVGETILAPYVPTAAGLLVIRSYGGYTALSRIRHHDGRWHVDQVPLPDHGLIRPAMSDFESGTTYFLYEGELQPQTLYRVDVRRNDIGMVAKRAAKFNSTPFVVEELAAKSADGVRIPYRVVHNRSMPLNRTAAVLIAGYGASGIAQLPQYNANLGDLWLQQGGTFVAAGVRGGGEYGDAWHVRGIERQRTYDDMLAIVRDLIDRGITAPKRIGLFGHSAGGLLAGVMITQQPDLFGAAILLAPMLDNFRLDLAIGGEGYFDAEYGSPRDARVREFLERTSPFQNLHARADFPVPLILTATDDQNVYPAQPRRFAAKMDMLGMPFLYHESAEGGHAAAAEGSDRARLEAWMYTYLAQRLIDPYPSSANSTTNAH